MHGLGLHKKHAKTKPHKADETTRSLYSVDLYVTYK